MCYQSIFEAYKRVISVIENNKKEIIEGHFYEWYSSLPLAGYYIDHHFFYQETIKFDPFDSADHCMPSMVKIINVTRQQDCWKIELEGNHNRQAQLILRNKQENQEEPILLRDFYHRRFPNPSNRKEGLPLPIPNNDYEVLEVWVDGVKKEIPHSSDKQ